MSDELQPIARVCASCGNPFVISVRFQQFLIKKGFTAPKRCDSCRQAAQRAIAEKLARPKRRRPLTVYSYGD